MKKLFGICWLAVLLVAPGSSPAATQENAGIDAQALQIVRAAGEYLHNLTSFRLELSVDMTFEMEGMRQEFSSQYGMAMKRPNRLAIVLQRGMVGTTIVCDGENVYTLFPMENMYTVEDAPPTAGETVRSAIADDPMAPFVGILVADDPSEAMMEDVTALSYLGAEELDGTRCHRLRFSQEGIDWELWIQMAEQPLLRRVAVDLSKMYAEMGGEIPGAGDITGDMTIRFNEWLVNGELPEDQFVFVPPDGAEKVDSFFDGIFPEEEETTHPLVGRNAPNFILELLDGGDVELTDHRGRDIVILDFWATWCAPCVRALPILVEVAETYKDRGVVFYAVNQSEDAQTVRAFLERERLHLNVPLDRDGKLGELYGAEAIPQTVVIAKDGTIQVVHVGFMPGLRERLSEELDALLSGADLAKKALVKQQAADKAGPEIRWPQDNAHTNRAYREKGYAQDLAELVGGYERFGTRSADWDAQAVEFLETWALYLNRTPGAPSIAELRGSAEALVDLGCDDPLILYGLGYALDVQNRWLSAENHLRAAVEGHAKSEYPRRRLALAASRLARYLDAWGRHDEARPFHQLAADTFLEVAHTSGQDRFQQQELTDDLLGQVRTRVPADIAKAFAEQLAKIETLDPCTKHTVLGTYHLRTGWDERGRGYAYTVTEEGWEGFRRELAIAREHLEEAYRLDPTRPEAAAEMIPIAMAGHARDGEDERLWFQRAIDAHIDWPRAYSAMLWAMRPRWSGSHEAMYRFGLGCMRSERYDTDVPFHFVQALLDIARDSDGSFEFWTLRDVYPAANEVLATLAAHPAHAHRASYYNTLAAGVAWATGHYHEARQTIDALGGTLEEAALDEMNVAERRILDDVTLYASSVAARVLAAEDAREWDRPGLAVERYEAALAETSDPALTRVLHDRLITARIYRDFLSDDWVPLTFERGLPGWRIRSGAWHTSAPHSVKGGARQDGRRPRLVCQVPIGDRFELRARIDIKNLRRRKDKNVGIFFRFREADERSDWQSFLVHIFNKEAWVGYRYWKPKGESIPLKDRVKQQTDFHLQTWDGYAALYLDGELVFSGPVASGEDWEPGALFGLAGARWNVGGYVKFENLELHRLTSPPEVLLAAMGSEEAEP